MNVSNPTSPTIVGSINADSTSIDGARNVAVSPRSNYGYDSGVASDSMAVSNPISPTVVGIITSNHTHRRCKRSGCVTQWQLRVVASRSDSITAVNVSDWTSIVVVGCIVAFLVMTQMWVLVEEWQC